MKTLHIVGFLSGILFIGNTINCMESSLVLYKAIKKDDENKNVKDLTHLLNTRLFKVAKFLINVDANIDKVFELKRNNLLSNAIMYFRFTIKYINEQKQIVKVNKKTEKICEICKSTQNMESIHWELGQDRQSYCLKCEEISVILSSRHRRSFDFGYRLHMQRYNDTYYWTRYSFLK
jgi:hypothetical protein